MKDIILLATLLAAIPLLAPSTGLAQESGAPRDDASDGEDNRYEHTHTMTEGEVIGPQPGPDHALQKLENPYRDDANAIKEGRRLFVWFNCSGCHGGRAGGGMGPSLRDAAWLYGNTHADIFNSILEGRAYGMPAWGTKLPDDQIWKLTAYIKSMDTDLEPDKPPQNPVYPDPPPRRDVKGVKAGGGDDGEEDGK